MARSSHVMEPVQLMNAPQICRESIRILLVHPTHFQSISIFFFSPLAVSLFISHFIIRWSPTMADSTLSLGTYLFGENRALPLRMLSSSIFSFVLCFPASITFSLLGKAATIQAVADSYYGVNLTTRRRLLTRRSGGIWVKLLHTYFWRHLIVFCLFWFFITGLALLPRMLTTYNICSSFFAFWAVLALLGLAFCISFAHVMVVGDLAWVLTVLESDCCGLKSMSRAKKLLKGRRHIALLLALHPMAAALAPQPRKRDDGKASSKSESGTPMYSSPDAWFPPVVMCIICMLAMKTKQSKGPATSPYHPYTSHIEGSWGIEQGVTWFYFTVTRMDVVQ
ncbi:hypothetical protein H6P81_003809 [Aristolochia fimbriata]|uniref:Uncharacterized protein n=1 Tax=Aristolochia fimbriata TaxID=158543 RepID=A0AAV7FH40_ARIFI|nr:hypothetical protein H6P81_003809 [Aristolochia fimbriata]